MIELLRSPTNEGEAHGEKTKLILRYLQARNGRTRLMAFALLANMMNYKDLNELEKTHPTIANDLVDLIFSFIRKADNTDKERAYAGISFDVLLRYLYRFLNQHFVKRAMVKYIPDLVQYATNHETTALRILRRISLNPELRQQLVASVELTKFLRDVADVMYRLAVVEHEIVEHIRQSLRADPPAGQQTTRTPIFIFSLRLEATPRADPRVRQAFISYCREDSALREKFVDELRERNIFTEIWIDKEHMGGNIYETIAAAIRASEVVFSLVSQHYCKSDICQMELCFAKRRKKKVFTIVLHRTFKIDTFDWLSFAVGKRSLLPVRRRTTNGEVISNFEIECRFFQTGRSRGKAGATAQA